MMTLEFDTIQYNKIFLMGSAEKEKGLFVKSVVNSPRFDDKTNVLLSNFHDQFISKQMRYYRISMINLFQNKCVSIEFP
jgi:hypothetical protein